MRDRWREHRSRHATASETQTSAACQPRPLRAWCGGGGTRRVRSRRQARGEVEGDASGESEEPVRTQQAPRASSLSGKGRRRQGRAGRAPQVRSSSGGGGGGGCRVGATKDVHLLRLHLNELLLAVHFDDEGHEEDKEGGAGYPGRLPR